MNDPRFRTLNAAEVHNMLYTEIYRVLETAHKPALYRSGSMRLDIRTREGRCVVPAQTLPDNWRDLTFALSALLVVAGETSWTRVIWRDDGETFVVGLGYSDARMAPYV